MNDWTIRKAGAADADRLARCIDAAYSVYAEKLDDLPAVSDGIADDIANNKVWVAVSDERIIGGIVLVANGDHVVVANVAVDPGAAGRGVGRALMDLAESEAKELGFAKLRLSTHVAMPQNVRLYEYLGWRETDRAGNKVHMEKFLSGGQVGTG